MSKNFNNDSFDEMFFAEGERMVNFANKKSEKSIDELLTNFYSQWEDAEFFFESENVDLDSECEREFKPEPKVQSNEFKIRDDKNVHKDHRKRVRNVFLEYGLESFTDIEVLELLLFYSIPQKDTNEIAHRLLDHFGTLKNVLSAEYYDLMEVKGINEISASLIILQRELTRYVNTKKYESERLNTSRRAGMFCCDYFKNHVEESFIIIILDDKDYVENISVISKGVENETAFYTRKVLKEVLRYRSNTIMLAHNHPGNNSEPSLSDIKATGKLMNALDDIGIYIKDHIVCAGDSYTSMADRGNLD